VTEPIWLDAGSILAAGTVDEAALAAWIERNARPL